MAQHTQYRYRDVRSSLQRTYTMTTTHLTFPTEAALIAWLLVNGFGA
jgi:hypothetical protein